jgi:hypothetical protein
MCFLFSMFVFLLAFSMCVFEGQPLRSGKAVALWPGGHGFKLWKQPLAKIARKGCVQWPNVVQPFPGPCAKRELHAPGCPFYSPCVFLLRAANLYGWTWSFFLARVIFSPNQQFKLLRCLRDHLSSCMVVFFTISFDIIFIFHAGICFEGFFLSWYFLNQTYLVISSDASSFPCFNHIICLHQLQIIRS